MAVCFVLPLVCACVQLSRPGVSAVSHHGLGGDEADGVAPVAKEEDIAGQTSGRMFEGIRHAHSTRLLEVHPAGT
jgi:hypothetical protein